MELSKYAFENLREYIYNKCGIVINDEKTYLIQQRLEPLAILIGCKDFEEFYHKLKEDCSPRLHSQVIEAITTNETSFFRDSHPFIAFKDCILPELGNLIISRKGRQQGRKGSKVRIWSAASSTGQEPYSISILICEYAQVNIYRGILANDFEIMATDISSKVLSQAIAGEFTEMEVSRGLSDELRLKYFTKIGDIWSINEYIRDMVEFRRLNLIEPFTLLGGFDVIFCRNVLIYFDDNTKRKILDQFHYMLSQQGFLVLGGSENVYSLSNKFKSIRHGETILYKKVAD